MVKGRIAALREAKGISQKQAAADLQMAYNTYRNYENGTNEPNNEALVKLAIYYGVSADYLLGHEVGKKEKSPPLTESEELTETLLDIIKSLDVSQIKDIIRYASYLIWLEEQS